MSLLPAAVSRLFSHSLADEVRSLEHEVEEYERRTGHMSAQRYDLELARDVLDHREAEAYAKDHS